MFLTEAKLPKTFWFWAIGEVSIRINTIPVVQQQDDNPEKPIDPTVMATPYFDYFWNFDMAHCVYGICCYVSATKLHKNFAPTNLKIALAGSNPDNSIRNSAYDEEYDGLQGLEVFTEVTTTEYLEYVRKYGDTAQAIPTMNLSTIQPDMNGDPT